MKGPRVQLLLLHTLGAVTRDTFTVVNDPFTAVTWRGACDRTFPKYIYHGKYPWLRQKEERNRP